MSAPTPIKRRVRLNIWGNWKGYESTRKVYDFGTDERAAKEWEKGGNLPKFDQSVFRVKIGATK